MGSIDTDPASTAEANTVIRAAVFYTKEDHGLAQEWHGNIWFNPPYDKRMGPFCEKLIEELNAGRVTQAVALTNNGTETRWWQSLAAAGAAVCFVSRRIKFWQPGGATPSGPLQGQTIIYFGPNSDGFRSEFEQFGHVAPLRFGL